MSRYGLLASFNELMYHLLWFTSNPYKADEPFGEGHPCWIEDYHARPPLFSGHPCKADVPLAMAC